MSLTTSSRILAPAVALALAACGAAPDDAADRAPAPSTPTVEVRDTTIAATFAAAGVAEPLREATLGTKLMGTVVAVLVQEGDRVAAGQPLVRIDARDLAAKQEQVGASRAEASAMERDAATNAARIRALYADSAATRAQLDAAETALARAEAAVRAADAAGAELHAMTTYSVVRAPFAGTVTKRFVDPGAFASPGMPLVTVQDASSLRIAASAPPDVAQRIRRGASLVATVESRQVVARVEGIVPAAGNVYTVNALVTNPGGLLLPGSAATLALPVGDRTGRFVPARAIVREGDLAGVRVRVGDADQLRWVRLGVTVDTLVEVTAGVRAGDRVVVPATPAALADRS
jgi:RND family efflux transporter MFP subunit